MSNKQAIEVTVNGEVHDVLVEPRKTLADVLRDDLGLTGTHLGCEHGVCGACTVQVDGRTVRSCLLFAIQADGSRVRTIEGLATDGRLHPIQEAFAEEHGLQCGFCTPGFLMSTAELLETNDNPTPDDIREALSGNLCRCTGYQGIIRAVERAARTLRERRRGES
jgi:carbon-monoxide dehydrogenase small subunit